jgi:hypothetical protein
MKYLSVRNGDARQQHAKRRIPRHHEPHYFNRKYSLQFGVRARTSRNLPMFWPTQKDMPGGVAIQWTVPLALRKCWSLAIFQLSQPKSDAIDEPGVLNRPPLTIFVLTRNADQYKKCGPALCSTEHV